MKVLILGDIFGRPGRRIVDHFMPELRDVYAPDVVIANGENAAGGFGLTKKVAQKIFDVGVNVITSGNHIWDQKEMYDYIFTEPRILRPANYPPNVPGQGVHVLDIGGTKVAVINLIGRVFMADYECPLRTVDKILAELDDIQHIIVDFHAETTSEKLALGWYLDGRVSCVVGTHTHVPTADFRLLDQGTAYITDLGMCGPADGILGVERDIVINKILTQLPARFKVAKGATQLWGIVVSIDESGRATKIEQVNRHLFV